MKYLKILVIALFTIIFQNYQSQEKAVDIVAKSLKQAKDEKKNVLVFFHASWCKWCHQMENNMKKPETENLFNQNYTFAFIDVLEKNSKKNLENPGGTDLLKKYNGDKAGLPFFVFLDRNGKVLADSYNDKKENLGCPATKEEVDSFIEKLKKTSKLAEKDLETIRSIFQDK